jgi:hypothetical protein
MATTVGPRAPLSDAIVMAVSRLVDDAGATREPSHYNIDTQIQRAGLTNADPHKQGSQVGKAKRVRAVLSWALDNAPGKGELFVSYLVALVRGCGGFRSESPNFVGTEIVADIVEAFRAEGFQFFADGEFKPAVLDTLAGVQLTDALMVYVRRAKRGVEDAALLTGTSKDLLEATAAHVITEKFGTYPTTANFPTLLGQAFVALGLAAPGGVVPSNEPPQRVIERSMYDLACGINRLRNKQGAGHGRPFAASVTQTEARAAVEAMGLIAEYMLAKLGGA